VIIVHDYFTDATVSSNFAFDKVRLAVDEFCAANKQNIATIPIGDECSIAILRIA
jgi:hypothetical protein